MPSTSSIERVVTRPNATGLTFVLALAFAGRAIVGPQVLEAQQSAGELSIVPVRGNVFVIVGAGSNVTVSAGVDGLLLVDAGPAAMADKVLAKVKEVGYLVAGSPVRMTTCVGPPCVVAGSWGSYTQFGFASPSYNAVIGSPTPLKPIRWIIETTIDPEHSGGVPAISAAGKTYSGGEFSTILGSAAGNAATVIGHENLLKRMTALKFPEGAWPLETYYLETNKMSQYVNGEGIQMYHAPGANTDGDTLVYFRFSDVIAVGDVYTPDRYPMIDLAKGGSVQGVIDGLNKIIELSFPEYRSQGGTIIVPGHGRLGDMADVAIYRNMVAVVRDRVQDLIKQGKSLQEIKAAKPTLDYDGIYESPDSFIEAVYQNLAGK